MTKNILDTTANFEGSAKETKIATFLGQFGIKYKKLTKDEPVVLISILCKSDLLRSPRSKRGRSSKNR